MKHTPGPWVINTAGSAKRGESFKVTEIYVFAPETQDDTAIFADVIDPVTQEPSEANARLIAAAPELLDRLTLIENLATQVCDAINKRDAIAYEETLISIKMLAREAIVEATDKGYHSFNQRGNSV